MKIKMFRRRKSQESSVEALTQPLEITRELRHQVFTIFNFNPTQVFNARQVIRRVEDSGSDLSTELCDMVFADLESEGVIELVKDRKNSYRLTRTSKSEVIGKVDMTASGQAYIVVEGADKSTKDIVVEAQHTMRAMNGDTVRVAITGKRRDGRTTGEVLEILEIGKRTFVGKVELSERFGFVTVDARQMPVDIFVPFDNLNGVTNGQKVVVEIISWSKNSKNPTGKILTVLGDAGDNDTEMHAILAQYNLPYHFPEGLEEQAEKIPAEITAAEIKKRRDMRSVDTFTIDPADAKDFDDALSLSKLPNGEWEVGVHIADVTHYVLPGSEIEAEAVERATSVYLVDRTIPMLPERLSNFLCSLRPNEDKLCFSAIIRLNDQAEIVDEWFGRTVIHSDRRYSYEEAQVVIENKDNQELKRDSIEQAIVTFDRLAKLIRERRFREGSIGFERDEAKFVLDEKGKPLSVYFKQMKDSNQLIEEFMLLANRRVAEFVGKGHKRTMVYRIHDTPNEEKYEKFRGFITRFGYHLTADRGKAVAKELTTLLHEVKGKAEENIVSTLAIRSMAKAVYSTENIGHYGLAFPFYSHFTSPIRRYPDMMVHRLLQHYLDGGKSTDKDHYEQLCDHSSAMEMRAATAERDSIKYKMVEFMEDKIGSEFDGIISGVTEWGVYIELSDTKIEGMVSLRDMTDDFYAFHSDSYSIIGHRSGRQFSLGDEVRIKVKRADLGRKQLDFEMVGTIDFDSREFTALPEASLGDHRAVGADNFAKFKRGGRGGDKPSGGKKVGANRGGEKADGDAVKPRSAGRSQRRSGPPKQGDDAVVKTEAPSVKQRVAKPTTPSFDANYFPSGSGKVAGSDDDYASAPDKVKGRSGGRRKR